jgi:nicotinate-nucleotide--dimethylbenzimidazole phosphoribosyltransferase
VTTQLTATIEATVERIVPPDDVDRALPMHVTGELRTLLAWWLSVSDGSTPRVAFVDDGDLTWASAADALDGGAAAADRAVDAGATLLVPRASARTDTSARAIVAVLTRKDPSVVLAQIDGMRDREWMAQVSTIRDQAHELLEHRAAPTVLMDEVEAFGVAYVAGALLTAAARRTPCLVDGTDECAAALIADRISGRAKGWWLSGSQSADPARRAAAERVDLAAGLPLALTDEAATGAQATIALLNLLTAPAESD